MQGLPDFWDNQGMLIPKVEYKVKFQEKRNDVSTFSKISSNLKGQYIFDILERYFNLLNDMKSVINQLAPISYACHTKLDMLNVEMIVVSFLSLAT